MKFNKKWNISWPIHKNIRLKTIENGYVIDILLAVSNF